MSQEIRTIRADEADEFLTVLCQVFELDKDRASAVFYSEPGFDLDMKWALFDDGVMKSILTVSPLQFAEGQAMGIAGVATLPEFRSQGHAVSLLEACLSRYPRTLLFAQNETVYRRVGFETVDEVFRGPIAGQLEIGPEAVISLEENERRYANWAMQDPRRLQRDELRWSIWKWSLRSSEEYGPDGYVTFEAGIVREAVLPKGLDRWPVPEGAEWTGLGEVTRLLTVPAPIHPTGLKLMARGFTQSPHFFMTDQF